MASVETRYCYRHPDRETGLSCSECGRPICADCATFAAVGIRCPDHAGSRGGRKPVATRIKPRAVRRAPGGLGSTGDAPITMALIAINVAIYLVGASQGGGFNSPGGSLYSKLWLDAPDLYNGGWWRLFTAAFLHVNIIHIGFNMLALYLIGTPVEQYLGRSRYIGLYVVGALAGSAGALMQTPGITVGASGAIFAILGAMLILEWQITGRLAGNAMTWIVINLVISFAVPNVSWGGHIGGLIGGILVTLAYAGWRERGRAAYGHLGIVGVLGLVLVGAASVAIAYWRVRGYV